MQLPNAVRFCMERLEQAGHSAYCVGGCVRDSLLGLTPHDYDLCTDALPEEMREIFRDFPLVRSGEKHGTIGVVLEKELFEITTFRTEGGYLDSRHPDWVKFVRSIQEDLSRRDFTVNAMAYNPKTGLCDPFGGAEDLNNHILRAVGDPRQRFTEDALRILRGVRFAVRYHLIPEAQTLQAMIKTAPLMESLARERVFEELCKLLPDCRPEDLIRFAPILTQAIPELQPCVGFVQHSPWHEYDVFTHTAQVVGAVPRELPLRWAALLHDAGKPATFTRDAAGTGHFYGHAKVSAQIADAVLLRLKAPTQLRQQVVTLVAQHMTALEPDKRGLKKRISRLGFDAVRQLLLLQQADMGGKGTVQERDFPKIQSLIDEIQAEQACLQIKDLAIDGHDLMALGLTGPAIGKALASLLEQVLEETIPNEKEALIRAVKENAL